MTEKEDRQWAEFARRVIDELVPKMEDSISVMHLVPQTDEMDVKFAVELGYSIMLDKPLIMVLRPGMELPPKLKKIADYVVCADLDNEDGRHGFAHEMVEIMTSLRHAHGG